MNSARAALLHDAVDRQAGEDIAVQPMTAPSGDVNARPIADPGRAAMTVTGVWVEPYVVEARRQIAGPTSKGHEMSATRPQVKIQEVLLPYAIARGDRVTRVATSLAFEVALAGSDGYGRWVLGLTARGSA